MSLAASLAIIPQRPNLARFATIIWLLRKRYYGNPTMIGVVTSCISFLSEVSNRKCVHIWLSGSRNRKVKTW